MRQIKLGEAEPRTTSVNGEVVHMHHVTYNKTTDSHYALDWDFNFEDVSQDELLRLAARTMVIQVRGEFKKASDSELEDFDKRSYSVREYLDSAGRKKADPMAKAKKALAGLSQEQKLAILEELGEG